MNVEKEQHDAVDVVVINNNNINKNNKKSDMMVFVSVFAAVFGPLLFGLSMSFTGSAIDTMTDNVK